MTHPEGMPPRPEQPPRPVSTVESWEQALDLNRQWGPKLADEFAERHSVAPSTRTEFDDEGYERPVDAALRTGEVEPDVFIVGLMRRPKGLRAFLSPRHPIEERPLAAWTLVSREVGAAPAEEGSEGAAPAAPDVFDDDDFGIDPSEFEGETREKGGKRDVVTERIIVTETGKTYFVKGVENDREDPSEPLRIASPRPRRDSDKDLIEKYRNLKRNRGVFDEGLTVQPLTAETAHAGETKSDDPITAQMVVSGLGRLVQKVQRNRTAR